MYMRFRVAVLLFMVLLLVAPSSWAQTSSTPSPTIGILPSKGDFTTAHELQGRNLTPNSDTTLVLFDPGGNQTVTHNRTDASGALNVLLQPGATPWQLGIYRAALALPQGASMSATFVAGDGAPHLLVEPDLPSPTSVINVLGIGLPASARVHLALVIAGGLGQRDITVSTDADGSFSTFISPQQIGFDFFSAGRYELRAPDLGLTAPFYIREHPSTSFIRVDGQVTGGNTAPVSFSAYAAGRFLWGIYAATDGQAAGEFMAGPTDLRGSISLNLRFPNLPPGQYVLGTPYDWGETAFTVPRPTPTATSTATATATQTATPTAAPSLKPRRVRHKACKHTRKHHKKRCKP